MFPLKTILSTLIGTGLAGSLVALPVRANEDNSVESTNAELILSQIDYGSRSYNDGSNDNFKNIVGLTGLAIGTGVIAYHVSKAYRPALANSLPNKVDGNSTALLTHVNPKLRRELLRLVHDRQTAVRLMNGTANSNPGRSANWVAEKVIYDLKRDR